MNKGVRKGVEKGIRKGCEFKVHEEVRKGYPVHEGYICQGVLKCIQA